MDVHTLISMAQKGSQRATELLADVPGLYTTNPDALADLIASQIELGQNVSSREPIDRKSLGNVAQRFHRKAGTLTDAVRHNIDLLTNGAPILRIAHQPNTFAYLGVYSQFIFLDMVATSLLAEYTVAPSQIYLIVDHDAAGDSRFRISHVPDVQRHGGSLSISNPIPEDEFGITNCAIEKPTQETIRHWISSLDTLA